MDVEKPYALKNYDEADIDRVIAAKYLDRPANLRRAWSRICTHLPETCNTSVPLDILEFSTAHGAMLEIWNSIGHNAEGTDFCVPEEKKRGYRSAGGLINIFDTEHKNPVAEKIPGWIYQPVIESIGAKVHLFDAGETPYSFDDKSFDYICCYQAIEAYARPGEWDRIVKEFCRIARKAVVIGFNPPPRLAGEDSGWDETKAAWEKLRIYDANGFKNVFYEFHETNRGLHPSACKLICTD